MMEMRWRGWLGGGRIGGIMDDVWGEVVRNRGQAGIGVWGGRGRMGGFGGWRGCGDRLAWKGMWWICCFFELEGRGEIREGMGVRGWKRRVRKLLVEKVLGYGEGMKKAERALEMDNVFDISDVRLKDDIKQGLKGDVRMDKDMD